MQRLFQILFVLLLFIACDRPAAPTEAQKTPEMSVELLLATENELGEGAFWNAETQEFWWVDIEGKTLNIYDTQRKTHRKIEVQQRIGTVVPSADGRFAVVALQNGVWKIDLKTEEKIFIGSPETDTANIRLNDGKCDPAGRLWVGSMHLKQTKHAAALFRINTDGSIKKMQDSVTISNGIAWSADAKTMYYIDTDRGNVRAYDYDNATGEISGERVVITVSDTLGYPDGMTIDAEGMLWIALWNGNCVSRWNPNTGELLQRIEVPAHNVSSCAFGGKNLDTLFITTARTDMTAAELKEKPLSGGVFSVVTGVKGVRLPFFGR
jgi:sugar lactone lactonase YvrE